ncbi:MAG: hypothetical protein PHI02_06930 [Sulfurovaceae bacterium]|nr:hypothetical protein [Sulfurovaceae bacterium]
MKWINLVQDYFTAVAVIFGMFLQFWIGKSKNWRIVVTIITSSLFLSLFIIPAILEKFHIATDSKFAIALYALSSVMSVMIIEIVIMSLPEMAKEKIKKLIGI